MTEADLRVTGGNDGLEIPGAIFDYYETVERIMGGCESTTDFFRLFLVPGMRHCSAGDGAFAVDYLGYLEAWVEEGRPPDVINDARDFAPVTPGALTAATSQRGSGAT